MDRQRQRSLQATRGFDYGNGSTYITYRNSLIIALLGVPGALIGSAMIEIKKFGRRGTLALSTVLTGVILYGSTTATNSNSLLGWNCGFSVNSNIMYVVLYAYTPEIFPTKVSHLRSYYSHFKTLILTFLIGSRNKQRRYSNLQPHIWHHGTYCRMFADLQNSAPVYTSGALFIAAGLICTILPYENQGKASL